VELGSLSSSLGRLSSGVLSILSVLQANCKDLATGGTITKVGHKLAEGQAGMLTWPLVVWLEAAASWMETTGPGYRERCVQASCQMALLDTMLSLNMSPIDAGF
jgi:hypothetical protein